MARLRSSNGVFIERASSYDEESNINRPQKEPLRFHIDTSNLPPHLANLVSEIQQTAENSLFHWKTFPLVLPHPIAVQEFNEGSSSTRRKPLVIDSLFNFPSWDDLDMVSVDNHGDPKHLGRKQLASIREHGTFIVQSSNFPGQHHTWRLNPLMQTGSEVSWEYFLYILAWAAAMIQVIAKERFIGKVFSIKHSVKSFSKGLHRFIDLIIGLPKLYPRDFEARMNEERSRYLVAELLCASDCQEDYISFCRFVRHLYSQIGIHGKIQNVHQHKIPPIPYIFQTPKGFKVDLRLFSREQMEKVKRIITSVLQQESKAKWSQHGMEKKQESKMSELESEKIGPEEEVLNRICESISNHPEINSFDSGLSQLLVDQAKATMLMKRAVDIVSGKFTSDLIQAEVDLRLCHPLLSLVKPWINGRLNEIKIKLMEEYRWKCHEEAIEACRQRCLDQFVYFLSRDLAFLKERAAVLSKELWTDQQASQTFTWETWIWSPHKWIVKRHFQGNSEVIPTHLSSTPTSITTPRISSHGEHQQQPVYTVERSSKRTTSTQWPFWRWANFLQRSWSWSWNAMYACGYLVPWCSPLGVRALVSSQPFYADLELSQVNGALCPRRSTYTPTLCSRLSALWRHISKSRTDFETKPDTGFMGKGLTRQLNRTWNYGIKGVLCSLLLLLFFPIICLLSSIGGVCLAATAPLWAPCLAFFYHICLILFYDVDAPNPHRSPWLPLIRILGRDLLLGGVVQPIGAFITASVICPLLAILLVCYGLIVLVLSRAWDGIMYNLVIRPRGRIPASDSCLVKRIAGPGLNTEFYYQISKEQALAAFEARLEADRLIAYRRQTERLIRQPAEEYRAFVQHVFTPFSATWCAPPMTAADKTDSAMTSSLKSSSVVAQLERETHSLLTSLEEKVDRRLYELRMPLTSNVLKKIRLPSDDLKMVLMRCAMMAREFYPSEILSRVGVNETELWERYNVEEGDWLSIAAIFLSEIFSPSILNPLNEHDTCIPLEPRDVNLSRYSALFNEVDIEDSFRWPQRTLIPQSGTFPDFSYFNPMARDVAHSSPPWKKRTHQQQKKRASGMRASLPHSATESQQLAWSNEFQIPLPIPHPVLICLLIYNRHRDIGAIPLESESCRLLIRWLEGSTTSSNRPKDVIARPEVAVEAAASKSPASHRPLLGSSGSDLATSQPSFGAAFLQSRSSSPSQHDTLVSVAQDGTLSLVGTLVSEHASINMDLCVPEQESIDQRSSPEVEAVAVTSISKSRSTLARAADTLRAALLGEKTEEAILSAGRRFSAENFELVPNDDIPGAVSSATESHSGDKKRKFPPYQSASFRSWKMNLPVSLRKYEVSEVASKPVDGQPSSPRPLGLLELNSALALDRGPAFSPAQLSSGRKSTDKDNDTLSSSQDSLPFAEEDASLVESPDWDQSINAFMKTDTQRGMNRSYCEVQPTRPAAMLASIEDLSVSIDSHTHLDISSHLGTQV